MNRLMATALILVACMVCGNALWAAQPTPNDIRHHVEQLCDHGRFADATHVGMKALLDARCRFGSSSNVTADYMTVVSEVARRRGKLHLAQKLYERALAIQASTPITETPETDLISEPNRLAALKQKCQALCGSGDFSGAVHASMTELLRVRAEYGNWHPYAAQYTAVVGDVSQLRGKPYLASILYHRAFTMLQGGIGTTVSQRIDSTDSPKLDRLD
jgi:hypothetical protein